MKKVYICSPCRGDYEKNITKAQEYCRAAALAGVIPIAPHVYLTQFLNDTNPDERELGLSFGLELLQGCDEVWVYGITAPSAGMAAEIKLARELGIPVLDGTEALAKEKPDAGSVILRIPGFKAMAVENQKYDREPFDLEIPGELILALADVLRMDPGTQIPVDLGGDRRGR